MGSNGLLDKKNDLGCIMYADDQYINRQYLQHTVSMDFDLSGRFKTYVNGKMLLDAFDQILGTFDELQELSDSTLKQTLQPVTVVFLDINMPVIDGLETAKLLKEKVDTFNKKVDDLGWKTKVLRPLLIHLTQYDNSFKTFIQKEEEADLYLQKPITRRDLTTLLRIMKFI